MSIVNHTRQAGFWMAKAFTTEAQRTQRKKKEDKDWVRVSAQLAASMALMASLTAPVLATDPAAVPADQNPAPPASAPAGVAPLPADQVKVLEAIVIQTAGESQWRPGEEAAWQPAKINDLMRAGAQIRTGRGALTTLRVGVNATIMIAAMTRIDLPEIVQAGSTLRTRAGLRRGKADFKVDQIGLTNDFEVITPTTVIAVRGTGYAVRWGALDGARIESMHGNLIRSIEVLYFATMQKYALDAGSISREEQPDPVLAALFDTIGPPPLPGTVATAAQLEQVATAAAQPPPGLLDQQAIDTSVQALQTTQSSDLINPAGGPQMAQLICSDLPGFLGALHFDLEGSFGVFDQIDQGFFDSFAADLAGFCQGLPTFQGDALAQIVTLASFYCGEAVGAQGGDPTHCVEVFVHTVQTFTMQQGGMTALTAP